MLAKLAHSCLHTCLPKAKVDVAQARVTSSYTGGADHIRCLQNLPFRAGAQSAETLLVCRDKLTLDIIG